MVLNYCSCRFLSNTCRRTKSLTKFLLEFSVFLSSASELHAWSVYRSLLAINLAQFIKIAAEFSMLPAVCIQAMLWNGMMIPPLIHIVALSPSEACRCDILYMCVCVMYFVCLFDAKCLSERALGVECRPNRRATNRQHCLAEQTPETTSLAISLK